MANVEEISREDATQRIGVALKSLAQSAVGALERLAAEAADRVATGTYESSYTAEPIVQAGRLLTSMQAIGEWGDAIAAIESSDPVAGE